MWTSIIVTFVIFQLNLSQFISLTVRQINIQDETITALFPLQNLNANASLHKIDVHRPRSHYDKSNLMIHVGILKFSGQQLLMSY